MIQADVEGHVVLRWTALGMVLGIALAYSLSRLMSSFPYGVELGNPWIYGGATVLLRFLRPLPGIAGRPPSSLQWLSDTIEPTAR